MNLHDYFSPDMLEEIEEKIEEVELSTSGEIKVVIADRCPSICDGDIDCHARISFLRLELDQTRDKTGILILLEMEEKRLKILADSGINKKFTPDYLQTMANQTTWHFGESRYVEGINELLGGLGSKLARFFPPRVDDTNELPNEVILEENQ